MSWKMKPDSLIHLRVPAVTKGRWVRVSRAAGIRLSDWIIDAVEAQMQQQIQNIAIPDDLEFSELRLARDIDGSVTFDLSVIERICKASGLPIEIFVDAPEDNVSSLIVNWYQAHRQHGGEPDPVAEDLIAEVLAEEKTGQNVSHKPGRA
jgi:antitoxin component of RelBE/YafQ-DinJ toxin-antitoxin module